MKFALNLLLLVLPALSMGEGGAEISTQPARVVQFHEDLLAMSDLETQGEREAFIKARVQSLFDIERIARVSLGRSWRKLDEESQDQFVALLFDHVVATYADRFDENRGQEFELYDTRSVRNGVVVESAVKPVDGKPVKLDYFFREDRVFNVAADGVSDLSLRRADYNSVLKEQGFEALIVHLEQKLDEIRQE